MSCRDREDAFSPTSPDGDLNRDVEAVSPNALTPDSASATETATLRGWAMRRENEVRIPLYP